MQELSTYDYLVKKLYNETEPTENQAIEEAFLRNPFLKEKYVQMEESKNVLDNFANTGQDVTQKSIDRILNFSKLTAILNHKN